MPYLDKEVQKEAQRQHYLKNRDIYRNKDRARLQKAREFVKNFKLGKSCIDCGESRWQCLEFDHRNPNEKSKGISIMIKNRSSIKRIEIEIAKCDIVCANCHRIRHNGCVWENDSSK